MKWLRVIIWCALILGSGGRGWAQPEQLYFTQVRTGEDAPLKGVLSFHQDRQGYLWMASQSGLLRYDGYQYTCYRQQPQGLSSSYVTSLAEDRQGRLWAGTKDGLNLFDPRTERFTSFFSQPGRARSLPQNDISALCLDREENLWIGTRSAGLVRLPLHAPGATDPSKAVFQTYRPGTATGLTDSAINCLYYDRQRMLWVGTVNQGLFRFEARTGTFRQYKAAATEPAHANRIWSLFQDDRGTLWVGTETGLYTCPASGTTLRRHLPALDLIVSRISQDKEGTLWFSSTNGLVAFNRKGELLHHYLPDPAQPSGLPGSVLTSLYHDQAGSLWVSAWPQGVARFDPLLQQVEPYRCTAEEASTSLDTYQVHSAVEDAAGKLWLGAYSQGALLQLDPATCALTTYRLPDDENLNPKWSAHNDLLTGQNGQLWLATSHFGVYRFDPAKGKFYNFNEQLRQQGIQKFISCNALAQSPDGTIWIATSLGGLISWNEQTGKARQYLQTAQPGSLSSNLVLSLHADASGLIWAGTEGGGLSLVEPSSGRVTRLSGRGSAAAPLPVEHVFSIFQDRQHRTWLGTEKGLWLASPDRKHFQSFSPGPTPEDETVTRICQDPAGQLWLNTGRGLSRFDPATGKFDSYDLSRLHFTDSEGGLVLTTRSGDLYFTKGNHLLRVKPGQLRHNTYRPAVVLTGVQVLNQALLPGQAEKGKKLLLEVAPAFADKLVLPYDRNAITFQYAALSFQQPGRNRYAYQLEGFDKGWVQAGNQRTATYTNLDPGTYRFRVKGTNNDGLWSREARVLELTVLPPPWRTWWAYTLYALSTVGLVLGIGRYWVLRQRLQADLRLKQLETRKLYEMDQLKTRFFTNISHEFRTPLTLILGPLEKWLSLPDPERSRQQDLRVMHRSARRLLQLINQLLDISKLEAGSLKLEAHEQDLVRYCRSLVYAFSSLAESRQIDLRFTSEEEQLTVYFDQDKLEKIITNLVSNAFKFTPEGGQINIRIQAERPPSKAGQAIISVSDSGIGIPANRLGQIFNRFYQVDSSHTREHEGTGIGLALVKELVHLHQGEVAVESVEGGGPTFTVKLPLGHQQLRQSSLAIRPQPHVPLSNDPTEQPDEAPVKSDPSLEPREELPLLLIVEDNADVRAYIKGNFTEGYRVFEATDGQQGLEKALEQVPDLVISDLMMPKMDGVELCRRLKTDERTSHIPVILLTAKATVESKLEGLETGADDYLTKPFQPQELQVRVRNLILQRLKLRERYERSAFALEPHEIAVTSVDEKFLQKALAVVETHMAEEDFDVEQFSKEMAMSRAQLYRKLKALTGQTGTEFIRTLRLKRAAQLLEQEAGNVADIAYQVGFQHLSYFSKCFKEMFGCSPSEYSAAQEAFKPHS